MPKYIITLTHCKDNEKTYSNDANDSINAFLVGDGREVYLGSFVPDSFNGSPYTHLDHLKELAKDNNIVLTLDNTDILVYGMTSGPETKHNNLEKFAMGDTNVN